jgi:tol-pal system protein YbgF
MMFRKTTILLLALTAAGCSGAGPLRTGEDASLADEVRELRAKVVELQRQAAMNEVELARLRQQVAELEVRTGGRTGAGSPPAARRSTRLSERAEPPAAEAPERAEPARPATPERARPATPPSRQPSSGIEEEDIDLPPPPPRAGGAALPAPFPEPAEASPSGPEALSPAAQAQYDRGYSLYHQGHYVDAEGSFQRFLQANPESELADNALYWIGECRYARADLRGALAAFRETVERYPQGNKVADALLKAGQCLEGLGDTESARLAYREVIRRFPATAASAVAEERRGKLP